MTETRDLLVEGDHREIDNPHERLYPAKTIRGLFRIGCVWLSVIACALTRTPVPKTPPDELLLKIVGVTLSARGREAVRMIAAPVAVLVLVVAWRILTG
jgi:hypothetical protein